jgi:hypothetical protein
MLESYTGTLRGNTLKWVGTETPSLGLNDEVPVIVTLLEKPSHTASGEAMAAAMRAIAAMPNRTIIEDPSAWQHEIRQDRPLPGRE